MLDFAQYDWLSFDCYGTLIDWEAGILQYLQPLLQRKGRFISDGEILISTRSSNHAPSRAPIVPIVRCWPAWCATSDVSCSSRLWKRKHRDGRLDSTLAALSRYGSGAAPAETAILSSRFCPTSTTICLPTRRPSCKSVSTASLPPKNCELQAFGREFSRPCCGGLRSRSDRLLHVAESLYHDMAPARIWASRPYGSIAGREGAAASKLADAQPDFEVPTSPHWPIYGSL